MKWRKDDFIPANEITDTITNASVEFAKRFGSHLGTDDTFFDEKSRKTKTARAKLTTTQLRKFFGEVKRQQLRGYNSTDFILLKPKLAYAVGRVKDANAKINDFYFVIADAIDKVKNADDFKRFIKIFEAIVAFHRAAEDSNLIDEN